MGTSANSLSRMTSFFPKNQESYWEWELCGLCQFLEKNYVSVALLWKASTVYEKSVWERSVSWDWICAWTAQDVGDRLDISSSVSQSVMSNSLPSHPYTVACHACLSVEFSRHEYCSVFPFPSPSRLGERSHNESSLSQGAPTLRSKTWWSEVEVI